MENTNLPAKPNNIVNQNPIAVLKNLNTFVKIKEFDKVGYLIMPICNKHAVLSGIDKVIDDFTKEEIAKYTAHHLKNLTFEEIEIAFQNERYDLYPVKSITYNFFSIGYFVEIITKYKDWKLIQMTKHNIPINQISLPENSESITEKNKTAIRIDFITHIFDQLKKTKKEYINDAFTLYDDFVEQKLIVVTAEQKKTLYSVMVKESVKETNEQIKNTSNKIFKKKLQSYLQILNNKHNDNLVANKCKAYLVCKIIASYSTVESLLKKLDLEK